MEDNLQSLIDMGFNRADAEEALKRCDNNVNDAINLLFTAADSASSYLQDPYDETDQNIENVAEYRKENSHELSNTGYSYSESINLDDFLNNTTPINVPEELRTKLEGYQDNGTDRNSSADYDKKIADYGYHTQGNNESIDSMNDVIEIPPVYDVYTDLRRTKRSDEIPPALLPNKSGFFESNYAPLIMILSEIPAFNKLILSLEFESYEYVPNWWRTERFSSKTEFVQEIQRLLVFLKPISLRAFASTKNLTEAAHRDHQLVQLIENCESINEIITVLFSFLESKIKKAKPSLEKDVVRLLTSNITQVKTEGYDSDDEDEEVFQDSIYTFPIESEFFSSNIYQTFHTLLWGEDLSKLGKLNLKQVSDIITICFENTGETVPGGLDLLPEFYPQVYLQEYSGKVKRKYDEMRVVDRRIQKVSSQIFKLRSFKGKPIPSFLESAQNHLSKLNIDNTEDEVSIASAVNNLAEITENIKKTKGSLADQLLVLQGQKSKANVYDIDYITQDFKEELEPWILTGVIVTDNQFCFLKKIGSNLRWFLVSIETERNKTYEIKECSFDYVKQSVQMYSTSDFSEGLVLFYVKESTFKSKEQVSLPPKLIDFINKDNSQLMEDLEQLGRATIASSDDDDNGSIDMDEEISSEASEQTTESGGSDGEPQGHISI